MKTLPNEKNRSGAATFAGNATPEIYETIA
jgi:hypothetical protein